MRTGSARRVWAAARYAPSGGVPLPSAALADAGHSGPWSSCVGGTRDHSAGPTLPTVPHQQWGPATGAGNEAVGARRSRDGARLRGP